MKFDYARFHLAHAHEHAHDKVSRRSALKLGAAGAAAAAVSGSLGTSMAGAQEASTTSSGPAGPPNTTLYTDEMFDVDAVIAGAWVPSAYGAADQRGTFNEITPTTTSTALARLGRGKQVHTYQMGEEMFNGFPAFPSDPPRTHDMSLYVFGYDAGPEFAAGGGIQSGTEPLGPNLVTGHEERFAENFTFQIATQIDGLNHVGTGPMYYNGHEAYDENGATDMITPTGTSVLGNETMGPIVTRGVIMDIVGLKMAQGKTDDYFMVGDKGVLRDNYRITIQDMHQALYRQRVSQPIGAGDIPVFHTGWTHLARTDPERYLTQEPGIYLSEARYLASRKVALIASDSWGLEVLDPSVTGGNAFPCHQELFGKYGIRIGESFLSDEAIADNVYDGVIVATPENVPGATCSSAAPAFLGKKGPAAR